MSLIDLAREAGRAGKSWNDFTFEHAEHDCSDEWPAAQEAYEGGVRETRLATWRHVWTTAIPDYDCGDTMHVEDCGDWHGKKLRHVVIASDHYSYQTARYWSGLCGAFDEDPRETDRRAQAAVARGRVRSAELDRYKQEREERETKHRAGLEWLKTATEDELEDFDLFESKGVRYEDVRAEKKQRTESEAKSKRDAEWARCIALVPEGVILVDDGAPSTRGQWGPIPGRDPHVYYNVRISHGWPDDADNASVDGEGPATRGGGVRYAGSLAYVADWIASGRLRIAGKDDVPPRAVVERIGHEQWKAIRRVEVAGRVVWVGRPRFASSNLVLDEKGHLVRSKKILAEVLP